ncbi:MAG: type II secretion system GspH family protein [Akkermansiaceae bacterium]|jgi:prepilin-type N-terminal cleavage/methylation domain-containing protein|nr:type II secretion system GspH family protein [Akkermansiaceae bacterium]
MKTTRQPITRRRGFTLLEMTIVIMVLIALISTGLFVNTKMDEWKLGRAASETLRQVYTAQRMFLADNPTRLVSAITNTDVIPYLPGNATSLPTVKSLTGADLGILVNVSPPVINAGSGVPYDPSGDNRDSLWDVGE